MGLTASDSGSSADGVSVTCTDPKPLSDEAMNRAYFALYPPSVEEISSVSSDAAEAFADWTVLIDARSVDADGLADLQALVAAVDAVRVGQGTTGPTVELWVDDASREVIEASLTDEGANGGDDNSGTSDGGSGSTDDESTPTNGDKGGDDGSSSVEGQGGAGASSGESQSAGTDPATEEATAQAERWTEVVDDGLVDETDAIEEIGDATRSVVVLAADAATAPEGAVLPPADGWASITPEDLDAEIGSAWQQRQRPQVEALALAAVEEERPKLEGVCPAMVSAEPGVDGNEMTVVLRPAADGVAFTLASMRAVGTGDPAPDVVLPEAEAGPDGTVSVVFPAGTQAPAKGPTATGEVTTTFAKDPWLGQTVQTLELHGWSGRPDDSNDRELLLLALGFLGLALAIGLVATGFERDPDGAAPPTLGRSEGELRGRPGDAGPTPVTGPYAPPTPIPPVGPSTFDPEPPSPEPPAVPQTGVVPATDASTVVPASGSAPGLIAPLLTPDLRTTASGDPSAPWGRLGSGELIFDPAQGGDMRLEPERFDHGQVWSSEGTPIPLLALWSEKKAGQGEDAEPTFLFQGIDRRGLVSVYDGMGGSGAAIARQTEHGPVTQAYVASRAVRHHTEAWYRNDVVGGAGEYGLADQLRGRLERALESERARIRSTDSRLSGSLKRVLPTTLAAVAFERSPSGGHRLTSLWAGDSRGYVLTPTAGLQCLTIDDTGEPDALISLIEDPPIDNVVCADRSFEIRQRGVDIAGPALVVTATDGCFGYLPTPALFEAVLLGTLDGARTMGAWADRILRSLNSVAGDDVSLSLAALDLPDLGAIQSAFAGRAEQIRVEHAERFSDPAVRADRTLLKAVRQSSWDAYRPTYEALVTDEEVGS